MESGRVQPLNGASKTPRKKQNAPKHLRTQNSWDSIKEPEVGSLAYHDWNDPGEEKLTSGQRAKRMLEEDWDVRGGKEDEQWGEGEVEAAAEEEYRDPTMDDFDPNVHEAAAPFDYSLAGRPAPPPPSMPPPPVDPEAFSEKWHPNICFEDEHNTLVLSALAVDYAHKQCNDITHRICISGRAYNIVTHQSADPANNSTSTGEVGFPYEITIASAPWQPSDPAPWTAQPRPAGPMSAEYRKKIVEERAPWGGLGTWANPNYSRGYPSQGSSSTWTPARS